MEDPGFYTTSNAQQRNDAEYVFEEYLEELSEISGRCIDVGSGPGDVAADLMLPKLHPKAKIVCSDISDSMVKFASERYKHNDRMSFVKLDIETPNLPRDMIGQFDHVFSNYCLHWCTNMRQASDNIFELLKPGGTALLLFLTSHPVYNACENLAVKPCFQPYTKDVGDYIPVFQHADHQRKTLKSMFKNSGFDVQHCSCRERTRIFNTVDDVRKTFVAINPFLRRMPADLRGIYEEELVQEVMNEFYVCDNYPKSHKHSYSIVSIYYIFVVFLKKPLCKNSSRLP